MIFQRPVIGLDISERSMEMVEVALRRARWVVTRHARTLIPSGVIERGNIKDPTSLIELVQETQKKGRFSKNPYVILSFPDSLVFTSIVSLPNNLGKQGVDKAVMFKARETMPISLDEARFDWVATTQSDADTYYVVSSSPKTTVETYSHVIQQAGMTPFIFDPQAFCTARGLGVEEEKVPTALIDIGTIHTVLSIFDPTGMQYNAYLETGSGHISQNIANALGISYVEADKMKIKKGITETLVGKPAQPGVDEEEEEEEEVEKKCKTKKPRKKSTKKTAPKKKRATKKSVKRARKAKGIAVPREQDAYFTAIEQTLEPILTDLHEAIDFYQQQYDKPIEVVKLIGGGANMKGLSAYMQQRTNIPVAVGNIRKHVVKLPKNPLLYLDAIGAGIRGLSNKPQHEGINLIKDNVKHL